MGLTGIDGKLNGVVSMSSNENQLANQFLKPIIGENNYALAA
jgi:hypothetical protein